jgi:hypothetical protein
MTSKSMISKAPDEIDSDNKSKKRNISHSLVIGIKSKKFKKQNQNKVFLKQINNLKDILQF